MEYADSEADESIGSKEEVVQTGYDSSEEEELENEEELLKKESVGFIVDNAEDEEDESESSQDERAANDDDDDSELDIQNEVEDLLDRPTKKRGRLQINSDDEDDDDDDVSEKRFRVNDDDETGMDHVEQEGPNLGSDEEEEDDMRNFIVDEGRPVAKSKTKIMHDDPLTQEAQELFGVDLQGILDELSEEDYSEDEVDSNDESVAVKRKRVGAVDLGEIFDPAELDRGFYTAKDEAIKKLDMPERFQLRSISFKAIDQNSDTLENDLKELENEAKWMYQIMYAPTTNPSRKDEITNVIKEVLNLLKVNLFEPPFIATYRKEYVEISTGFRFSMKLEDLWNVYFLDEQWIRLRNKQQSLFKKVEKLIKVMEKIRDSSIENVASLLQERLNITETNPPHALLEFIKKAENLETLSDCTDYFNLYFKSANPVEMEVDNEDETANEDEDRKPKLKATSNKLLRPSKTNPFILGRKSKINEFSRYFGLKSSQFAEHVRDQYAMHECDSCPITPLDAAEKYISTPQNPTKESVLKSARSMLAYQMSCEPEVRRNLRTYFQHDSRISVVPTKKGKDEIDEIHPLFPMKYLIDKPIISFENNYNFLYIDQGSQDQLITYKIYLPERIYNETLERYKMFFHRDEYNIIAQQWNEQRELVIKEMIDEYLTPLLIKEVKHSLMKSSQDALLKEICEKVYNKINVQPFIQSIQKGDVNYDERDATTALGRILSLTYSIATSRHEQSYIFALVLDGDGEVLEKIKLTKLIYNLRRKESPDKTKDLNKLSELIIKHRPHACAIATDDVVASDLQQEIQRLISTLENQHDLNPIPVELVDNELSIVYQNSKMAESDFPLYPAYLRQAVSLGRRLQDPLTEFARLMNVDQDLLNLQLHPLQNIISKDNLYRKLEIQFVNVVNTVGVDINNCISHKHRSGVLQFVSGLGSRKADYLLKTIKRNLEFLPSRNLIIQNCDIGPKVGMNCLGFIKINHASPDLEFDDDVPRELLDSTRIHPESYDLAKKMAIDALEWDDRDNQAAALEEILDSPEKLRDLDLEAFAEELKRTEHGTKHITLNDIRKELTNRFEDYREKFRSIDAKEKFELLTKESADTLDTGSLVQARIVSLAHKKPLQEQLDHASPKRNEVSGFWICPFCQQENFVELNNIWQHFDSQECPGKVIGVFCQLPNRVRAFLATKNISDNHVSNILDRVELDMMIYARIIRVDYERLQVEISTKSSDLQDTNGQWRKQKDSNYDDLAEDADKQAMEEKIDKQKKILPYVNRVIFHDNFKNITYNDFEKLCPSLELGEFIIRPSSKGANHLTISLKVDEDVVRHIDVIEEDKDNDFSLGRVLIIDGEKFEDLDEIIASYIQPMATYAREAQNFKYYKRVDGDNKDLLCEMIREEKQANPARIPYFIAPMRKYPCAIVIVYMPDTKERMDIFKITPKGFVFRNLIFHSFMPMIDYFKSHFNDRPSNRTTPGTYERTPMIGTTPTFATPQHKTPENQRGNRNSSDTPNSVNSGFSSRHHRSSKSSSSHHHHHRSSSSSNRHIAGPETPSF